MSGETQVELDFFESYWRMHPSKSEETCRGESVYLLEYGWDAGMTEEEVAKMAEDSPGGKIVVKMVEEQLRDLRDDINELLGNEN